MLRPRPRGDRGRSGRGTRLTSGCASAGRPGGDEPPGTSRRVGAICGSVPAPIVRFLRGADPFSSNPCGACPCRQVAGLVDGGLSPLRRHCAELARELGPHEDQVRLWYVCGADGVILVLDEELRRCARWRYAAATTSGLSSSAPIGHDVECASSRTFRAPAARTRQAAQRSAWPAAWDRARQIVPPVAGAVARGRADVLRLRLEADPRFTRTTRCSERPSKRAEADRNTPPGPGRAWEASGRS